MREAGTFRPPAAVQWIATRACDLTCDHCYTDAGPRHAGELTTDEALALVDAIADMGAAQLVIAGGEPLLRKDLDRIVARAAERGLPWALHTHGGLVRRRPELFRDAPPAMVAVSLDGPEAVHDRFRGREGSYRDALAAIRYLVDETECPAVVAGTVVNRLNADLLADMEADVRASGATSWGLHLFAPEGRGAAHTALCPTPGQLQRAAAFARRKRASLHVELDNEWGSAGVLDPFYRDHPFLCGAGRFTCVVGVDGAIVPCTTTDPGEAEGNVRTHALAEVWRTGFGRFRGDGTDATCADGADCWLQTRNGHSVRADAFGIVNPARAVAADLPAPRSPRPSGALRWAAVAALAAAAPVSALAAEAESCAEVDGFPAEFSAVRWARQGIERDGRFGEEWGAVRSAVVSGRHVTPPKSLEGVVSALGTGERRKASELLAALDAAEAEDIWDAWLVGQLWQRVDADEHDAAYRTLLGRLHRHARVAATLVKTQAATGPVRYQPWMSKAASPRDYIDVQVPEGFVETAKAQFAKTDAGTWSTEVTLDLQVKGAPVTLCRGGVSTEVKPGSAIRLGRLDAVHLSEGAKLVHTTLGELSVGRWVGAGGLGRSEPAVLRGLIDTALTSGKPADVDRVAAVLLVAAPRVRVAVADRPQAPGAPALRQLLALYDE